MPSLATAPAAPCTNKTSLSAHVWTPEKQLKTEGGK